MGTLSSEDSKALSHTCWVPGMGCLEEDDCWHMRPGFLTAWCSQNCHTSYITAQGARREGPVHGAGAVSPVTAEPWKEHSVIFTTPHWLKQLPRLQGTR